VLAHGRDGGHLDECSGDAEAGDEQSADERRSGRGGERRSGSGVGRLDVDTLHEDHRDADEVLDSSAGRGQRSDQILHDLRGLGGRIVGADELTGLVGGVLAADVDRRGAGGTMATWLKAGLSTSPEGRSSWMSVMICMS